MKLVFMDIESRSTVDLTKRGINPYKNDVTTSIMCAAFVEVNDSWDPVKAYIWSPTFEGLEKDPRIQPRSVFPEVPVEWLTEHSFDWGETILLAHNAGGFDAPMWAKHGPSWAQPASWMDTIGLFRQRALPGSLDAIGDYLFDQRKDAGSAVARKYWGPYQGHMLPLTRAALVAITRYCILDTLIMAHAWRQERMWEHCAQMPPMEFAVMRADRTINDRGVSFDVTLATAISRLEEELVAKSYEEIEKTTDLHARDLRRRDYLLDWLRNNGLPGLPDLRKPTLQRALDGEFFDDLDENGAPNLPVHPHLFDVLRARLDTIRITISKIAAGVNACDDDGRIRNLFAYFSAHSGRWGGRRIQPQNLPSPKKGVDPFSWIEGLMLGNFFDLLQEENPHDVLSSLIRLCFAAPEGKHFAILDFSKIECVGLAWYAGETDLVNLIAAGGDPYRQLAAKLYGVAYEEVTDKQRQIGKIGILGCGYGMGAGAMGLFGAASGIDFEECGFSPQDIVDGYRDAYPKIAGFRVHPGLAWRTGGLWKALDYAIKSHYAPFVEDGKDTVMILPSGRPFRYRDSKVIPMVPGYVKALGLEAKPKATFTYWHPRYKRTSAWGGKITENLVQAFCRDIMAEALVRLETAGYPVVLHVHDEVVVEIDDPDQIHDIAKLVIQRPMWCQDMPIAAEGFVTTRYTKGPPPGTKELKWR